MVAVVWRLKPQLEKIIIHHQQDRGYPVEQLKKPNTKCIDSQTKITSQIPERRRLLDATASPQQLHCQHKRIYSPCMENRPTGWHKRH